jgi:hypothetical protein
MIFGLVNPNAQHTSFASVRSSASQRIEPLPTMSTSAW